MDTSLASHSPSLKFLLVLTILVFVSVSFCLALPVSAQEPQQKLHLVTWGETISSISLMYGVSVEALLAANGLANANIIQAGQALIIPLPTGTGSPSEAPSPEQSTDGQLKHTVVFGESLSAIAARYGLNLYDLAAANGIANPDLIQPGQVLIIPSAEGESTQSSITGSNPTDSEPSNAYHVVSTGETLSSIALYYGVSLDDLIALNGIATSWLIYPGQKLLIPGQTANTELGSSPEQQPSGFVPAPQTTSLQGAGVCVHLYNQNADAVLSAVDRLGFDWIKIQVEWKLFEPQKGNYQWSALDEAINAAARHGKKVLISVVKAPNWARPTDTDLSVDGPPANPKDYGDYMEALASRYRGQVAAYEIWNEQNLWYEWGGKGKLSAAEYVSLLREAYSRIKAVDASAIIISGGLTPTGVNDGYTAFDDVHYLGQMYAAGAASYFDALGAHPSGYNNPPDDTPEVNTTETTEFKGHWSFYYRRYEQLHDVMVLHGEGHKQIWFTEFGWSSQKEPPLGYEYAIDNTEEQQARYLLRAFEIARSQPYVGVMFVWNLNYSSVAGPNDEKAGFSLMNADGSPRPAYIVLANMPK